MVVQELENQQFQVLTMKGTQAISVTLLMSFLVLATRGKDVRYRRQEEDSTQILTYQGVNKTIQV